MTTQCDHSVLDFTQDLHDRIDAVHGRTLEARATLGGVLNYELKQVQAETEEQDQEMLAVWRRILSELLGVSGVALDRLLAQRTFRRQS